MTEEEQRDFDSFAIASPSVQGKKGKTPLWKASQENPKIYSQAQQAQHETDLSYTSQAQPLQSQALVQAPVQGHGEVGSQHQPPQLVQAQAQDQPQGQA